MDSLRWDTYLITTGTAIRAAKKVHSEILRMRLCILASSNSSWRLQRLVEWSWFSRRENAGQLSPPPVTVGAFFGIPQSPHACQEVCAWLDCSVLTLSCSPVRRRRSSRLFCRLAQWTDQPQRGAGVVQLPVAVVHPVGRICVWCGIGILRHGVEGQRLHRLRKRCIGVRVFGPSIHKQQKVAFPPCHQLRETRRIETQL